MPNSVFLDAFIAKNKTVPVWFMRQAGRYLPEYQAIRAKYSLDEMFANPELASEITCQPVDILGVDAAILFADILTLPAFMGVRISFDKTGPKIEPLTDYKKLHDFSDIPHIRKTIRLIKDRLKGKTPLIGFAGSPFTVLVYLIEGGGPGAGNKIFQLIYSRPEEYARLMEKLTENTIKYLNLQKKEGIDAFQVFDTFAGLLSCAEYEKFVLPYLKKIFKNVFMPSIYFAKNTRELLPAIKKCGSDFLSVDHSVVIGERFLLDSTKQGIQGNLFNGLLFSTEKDIERETKKILQNAKKHKRFIFNLSHGVLQSTSVEKLRRVVEIVHGFKK